jgi:hypothetical protein
MRMSLVTLWRDMRRACPPQEGLSDFCSRNRKIVAEIVRFWQIKRHLFQTLTRSATTLVTRPSSLVTFQLFCEATRLRWAAFRVSSAAARQGDATYAFSALKKT